MDHGGTGEPNAMPAGITPRHTDHSAAPCAWPGKAPSDADRRRLLLAVGRAARDRVPESEASGFAREAAALEAMTRRTSDQQTQAEAADRLDLVLHQVARAPALTPDDLAAKLAALVHELARAERGNCEGGNGPAFLLAACALADATILRAGPIPLGLTLLTPADDPPIVTPRRAGAVEVAP